LEKKVVELFERGHRKGALFYFKIPADASDKARRHDQPIISNDDWIFLELASDFPRNAVDRKLIRPGSQEFPDVAFKFAFDPPPKLGKVRRWVYMNEQACS